MKLKNILLAAAFLSTAALAQNADEVRFPDMKSAWLKDGTFVNVANLRHMGRGMSADQVRELISYPHFSEGFTLSNWNYIFNFRTGRGDEFVTCQYQVQFKDGKSSAMYWKDNQCEAYLKEKAVVVNQTHPITLNSDGLFAFGRSGLNDLQPTGRENLQNLVNQMKTGYSKIRSVEVIGYTDRFGSVASNMQLSLARANSVKSYLVAQGISANLIRTQGAGSSKSVVNCPGSKSAAVIGCLMPNRRIEVSINGDM